MQAIDQQIADRIRQSIIESCHPLKIMMFGSYATVKGRLAIRKALKALGKNIAFDFIQSTHAVFEKARNHIGTIQHVAI